MQDEGGLKINKQKANMGLIKSIAMHAMAIAAIANWFGGVAKHKKIDPSSIATSTMSLSQYEEILKLTQNGKAKEYNNSPNGQQQPAKGQQKQTPQPNDKTAAQTDKETIAQKPDASTQKSTTEEKTLQQKKESSNTSRIKNILLKIKRRGKAPPKPNEQTKQKTQTITLKDQRKGMPTIVTEQEVRQMKRPENKTPTKEMAPSTKRPKEEPQETKQPPSTENEARTNNEAKPQVEQEEVDQEQTEQEGQEAEKTEGEEEMPSIIISKSSDLTPDSTSSKLAPITEEAKVMEGTAFAKSMANLFSDDLMIEKTGTTSKLDQQVLKQILQCWKEYTPNENDPHGNMIITGEFDKEGNLLATLQEEDESVYRPDEARFRKRVAKEAAQAISNCSPLKDMPQKEHEQWRVIKFKFHY